MKYIEKKLTSECVFEGKVFSAFNDKVQLHDGSASQREIVRHKGGCCILPIIDDCVMLVKQFRYAYNEEVLEIPAGKLESGEDPRDCATRELREEVGATANRVTSLGILYPTPGYVDEKIHIYLAQGLTISDNCLDEGEYLDVVKLPIDTAVEMIKNNEIRDSKTVVAILRYIADLL